MPYDVYPIISKLLYEYVLIISTDVHHWAGVGGRVAGAADDSQ